MRGIMRRVLYPAVLLKGMLCNNRQSVRGRGRERVRERERGRERERVRESERGRAGDFEMN